MLYDRKWVLSVVADKAKAQFSQLLFKGYDEWSKLFNKFNWNKDRLSTFYCDLNSSKQDFCELWNVCQLVSSSKQDFCELWSLWQLVSSLSYGNAGVKNRFSVNGDILVENLKETCPFCSTSSLSFNHMWCVARFGSICTTWKTWKTSMEEC